jgi:transposase InsO family protein
VRSIERWLKEEELLRPWRRTPAGPKVPQGELTVPQRLHQVWTVDFKGWWRTRDGQRQEPLTIREGYSRYLLAIRLLPNQSDLAVRAVFREVFRVEGLPEAIRVDNGVPFSGKGPLGLTRLSVWWWRLGTRVEFTRKGRPGDNAGHEQMHGLLEREVVRQAAAANRKVEQRRVEAWRREYNQVRPHEALGQRPPSSQYQRSPRRYAGEPKPLVYPSAWAVRRVRSAGDIKWQGRLRSIGRAFVGERVGLESQGPGQWKVYLGSLCIGELRASDPGSMRPAQWQRSGDDADPASPA